MNRSIVTILACAALAACAGDPKGAGGRPAPVAGPASAEAPPGVLLTAEQYVALVRGNSFEGTSSVVGPFAVYVAEDRSQRLQFWRDGVERRTSGRLSVIDGEACSAWDGVRGGAPRCSRIYKDGDTLHAIWADGGGWSSSYRIVPGNPRNL